MSRQSLWQRGGGVRKHSRRRSTRGKTNRLFHRRLRIEPLEDRRLLSITVNSLTDELDGSIVDGDVSLRDALLAATPFTEINFDPALTAGGPATLQLTLGELRITKDLTLFGPGASLLTIDASGGGSRVFNVSDGSVFNIDVRIQGLSIRGGIAQLDGGGIRNFENLTATDVNVTNNASQRDGGGIFSSFNLTLINSTVSGNTAVGGGGGVFSSGPYLTIENTNILYNSAANGAGVFSGATSNYLTINNSELRGNTASGLGGGIVTKNGNARVTNSTLSNNHAQLQGGGIFSEASTSLVRGTTISSHRASHGAGIWVDGGSLSVNESALYANFATVDGGGIYSDGAQLSVLSSTISGNSAINDGGGIWTQVGPGQSASVAHSTVVYNRARAYYGGFGAGGGIITSGATVVTLNHTILAKNRHAGTADDIFGRATASFSLIGVDAGALIDNLGNTSQIGTLATPIDPLIGQLADNGGPTFTHMLLPGSPAIDAGDKNANPGFNVPQFDQRGATFLRIRNGDTEAGSFIDIGALEVAPGTVRGRKWNDLNSNGALDEGEPGLPGWQIFIDTDDNGQFDSLGDDLEPDDYAPGTVLNTIKPSATLSVDGFGGSIVTAESQGLASTGTLSFGNSVGGLWYDSVRLRVEFAAPTDNVSIDVIGDDSFDLGRLQAFDSNGVLLATYDSPPVGLNQSHTMSIVRPTADISFMLAFGLNGEVAALDNLIYGSSEPFATTDANGDFEFPELAPGTYEIAEVPQFGWVQTGPRPINQTLAQLHVNNAEISALVPTRYDFFDGDFGVSISDGGNDMYDGGNVLNTDVGTQIQYTGGFLTPGDFWFGPGSQYFTAKFQGLFVMGAAGISINTFEITGNNGADGGGQVNGDILHTTVNGQEYTIFVKRVFAAGDPTVNHIIMVPGDGTGVSHTFDTNTDNDLHTVTGLSSVSEIYYALVAQFDNGQFLPNADILNIANEFLSNIGTASVQFVTVASGQTVEGIDFGNHALPGSINGQKWFDADGDGFRDPGEGGLAGWTIYLDENEDGQLNQGLLIEPDDYALGTVLNTVKAEATLSVAEFAGVNVIAAASGGFSSTGTLVFGSDVFPQWFEGHSLRVDFAAPTDTVSIDAISDDDLDRGTLSAYDSAGTLLGTYNTADLAAGAIETMTIARPTADIAYVIATGLGPELITLDRLIIGKNEPTDVTDMSGNYSFLNLPMGNYMVGEVVPPNWEQTAPISLTNLLNQLAANNAAITSLVPNRFDFSEGETGEFIIDGGNNLYDVGNILGTNLGSGIDYTNGLIASSPAFGPGSQYFTAKYPGLFVMGATNISISRFEITGNAGADGSGSVNGAILHTTVGGKEYTILLKRTFNTPTPTINQLIIVPGTGVGVTHTSVPNTDNDIHTVNGLGSVTQIYYLLVSTLNGIQLNNTAVIDISNAFLANITTGNQSVVVGAGQDVMGIDFGNHSLVPPPTLIGDYNLNGFVDSPDYTVWRNTKWQTQITPFSGADGNGDGNVTQDDYAIWKANYGKPLIMAGSGQADVAPAEPVPADVDEITFVVDQSFGTLAESAAQLDASVRAARAASNSQVVASVTTAPETAAATQVTAVKLPQSAPFFVVASTASSNAAAATSPIEQVTSSGDEQADLLLAWDDWGASLAAGDVTARSRKPSLNNADDVVDVASHDAVLGEWDEDPLAVAAAW
jgi:hypothetical protein